jgi:hypothetical protein
MILYLLGASLPLVTSWYVYKNSSPRFVRIWRRMERSENARRLAGKIIALYIALLHILLYSIYPRDLGLVISTMMMLALLSTERSLRMLKWIRYSNKRFVAIGFIALAFSFYSLLMSTALTLASILTTALFLPNPELRNKIASESQRNEDDGMFTTLFFA